MKKIAISFMACVAFLIMAAITLADGGQKPSASIPYPIVDTGQTRCYDNYRSISAPRPGSRFYGQDAQYSGNTPAYVDNGDGTITDQVTGLMWQKADSQKPMSWQEALAWAQRKNQENYLGHNDWRLPNAKELQSVVDYSRSPQQTGSAAISPLFEISTITDEGGNRNYPFFWSSTTHTQSHGSGGQSAVYVCFGEALGFFKPPFASFSPRLMDVHGAGAQRSDPKTGNPDDFRQGRGPQGDVVRIYNYVRLVRDS